MKQNFSNLLFIPHFFPFFICLAHRCSFQCFNFVANVTFHGSIFDILWSDGQRNRHSNFPCSITRRRHTQTPCVASITCRTEIGYDEMNTSAFTRHILPPVQRCVYVYIQHVVRSDASAIDSRIEFPQLYARNIIVCAIMMI